MNALSDLIWAAELGSVGVAFALDLAFVIVLGGGAFLIALLAAWKGWINAPDFQRFIPRAVRLAERLTGVKAKAPADGRREGE